MKSFSKLCTSLLLGASIITASSVTAFAWGNISYPDGGTHNYGVKQPGNGYEMGYSYYYHGSRSHGSSVAHNGKVVGDSGKYAAGSTSIANGPSVQVGQYTIDQYYRFM